MKSIKQDNCYTKYYQIPEHIFNASDRAQEKAKDVFAGIDNIKEYNQIKVLNAFRQNRISEVHFQGSTGYGYNDRGRDTLEMLYADLFSTEDALVRQSITTGTHAIAIVLFGCLRPGDLLLSVTGKPYDTLDEVIGIREGSNDTGSLKDFGVSYNQIELRQDGTPDYEAIQAAMDRNPKMVFIQRSKGYLRRPALSVSEIGKIVKTVKSINKDCIVFVDNCYGEFTDIQEPTDAGADVVAGSLIKNPGGGLAPSGGYIAGSSEIIEMAASRYNVPGLGKETGCTLGDPRLLYQGIYMAPHIVAESLKGMVFAAAFLEEFGFESYPKYDDVRNDIVQSLYFDNKEQLITFCQGIQTGSPVDSFVTPTPWAMPGYDDEVIMAAGAFVQGSSLELSMDAPIKEPYTGYLQGGLTYENVKLALMVSMKLMFDKKLL
ncbi:MAG TPA: hypothetical protein DDZ89_06525 [Clostridiales bacterium]|nr:hypothetical protein [Clostridiales bacterium]